MEKVQSESKMDSLSEESQALPSEEAANANTLHNNTMAVKMIGTRLWIDGFLYVKQVTDHHGKCYWRCKKWKKDHRGCQAKATTTDPCTGEKLIVTRGPNESNHNHSPCHEDVEEAEEEAKFGPKRAKRDSMGSVQVAEDSDTKTKRVSRSLVLPNKATDSTSDSAPSLEAAVRSKKRKISTSLDPEANQAAITVKLIGKRLYIDGYIYAAKRYDNRTYWECKRALTTAKCSAKAITSDPSKCGELIVHQGPDISKHNHLPDPEEVMMVEKMVRYNGRTSGYQLQRVEKSDSKSSDALKTVSVTPKSEQSRPPLNRPRLGPKALKASKKIPIANKLHKTKRYGLVNDSKIYRKFLLKFSKSPVFNKLNVMHALKGIYQSQEGCFMGYVTILENREKVEQDLVALKNDPTAKILAINTQNSPTVQKDKTIDSMVKKEEMQIQISNVSSLQGDEKMEICQLQKTQMSQKSQDGGRDPCASVQFASTAGVIQSLTPLESASFENSSSHKRFSELQMKDKIICMDFTDDDESVGASCETGVHQPNRIDQTRKSRENSEKTNTPVSARNEEINLIHREQRLVNTAPSSTSISSMQNNAVGRPSISTIDLVDSEATRIIKKEIAVVDLINDDSVSRKKHPSSKTYFPFEVSHQEKENQPELFRGSSFNIHQQMYQSRQQSTMTDSNAATLISCVQVPLVHEIGRFQGNGIIDSQQFYTEIRVYRRDRRSVDLQSYPQFLPPRS